MFLGMRLQIYIFLDVILLLMLLLFMWGISAHFSSLHLGLAFFFVLRFMNCTVAVDGATA